MRGFTNRTGTQYKYYDNKIYIFHIKIIYSVWCFHHTLRLIINLQRSFLWVNNNFNSLLTFSLDERFDMDIPVLYNGDYYLKQKIEIDENYVENENQEVYCLITNSHNFTINDFIVHNCRGYRSEWYPDGIDTDTAQYLSSLIPQERGFLWSIHDAVYGNEEKGRAPITALANELDKYPGLLEIIESIDGSKKKLALKHLFC